MAPGKTEALLVTDRRSFQYPRIVLGEHEVEWKTSIKYLEVELDRRLSFDEHLRIATAKAIQCGVNLCSAYAKHWWTQGSKKETGRDRGAFEAALGSSGLG